MLRAGRKPRPTVVLVPGLSRPFAPVSDVPTPPRSAGRYGFGTGRGSTSRETTPDALPPLRP